MSDFSYYDSPKSATPSAIPSAVPSAPTPPLPPSAPSRGGDGGLRMGLVAAIAGLVGALLGSSLAVAVVSRPAPAVSSPRGGVQAPVVAVPTDVPRDRVAVVAAAVIPSVVRIDITAGPTLDSAEGNGSGVIFRSDGYIITNNHVVAGAGGLEVVFADRSSAPAEVVGTDPETDLAVIKVDRVDLPAIQIGDSAALQVGELAIAVGSPFGLEGSVTAGVVSALERQIPVSGPDGRPVTLPSVIQTDAPINPGNSGGPLVSGEGRLIGINSAILTSGAPVNGGVGFAIPVNTAVDIANELIESGVVRHPFLGIAGSSLNREAADRLGLTDGAFIEAVEPGTPAALAGLREGDVILKVADMAIDSMATLVVVIRNREVGETVPVTFSRDGTEQTVDVTLAERPR